MGQFYGSEQDRAMQMLSALMGQAGTPTQQTVQQQGSLPGLMKMFASLMSGGF